MMGHSALFSLFHFIILDVLPAGIFAVLANMMLVSNLMFPEFFAERLPRGPIANYLEKEKFADIRNEDCVGLGSGF